MSLHNLIAAKIIDELEISYMWSRLEVAYNLGHSQHLRWSCL